MSRKPKSKHLLEKSIQAAISAIEIYNKPDFKYREESFCILMVNAWEVLLKAKIITTNQNKLNSIFVIDKNLKKKDGTEYKKTKYKKNRAGNEMTIDIFTSLKIIKDDTLKENIKLLVEMRDNAIHFYNESKYFEKKVLEIGTATLKSYVHCVNDWFNYDLAKYNFYLMPISFFHLSDVESFSINKEDQKHQNLLKYIAKMEKENPSDENKQHNISLVLETKFVRSKTNDAIKVKIDPDAKTSVKIDSEDQFKNKYPWSYKDNLIPELKESYTDFKQDKKFWNLKNELEKDKKYCGERYLDYKKKTGTKKKFYSPSILDEFDKYYTKKTQNAH